MAEPGHSHASAKFCQYMHMGFSNAESRPTWTQLAYRISNNIRHYPTLLFIEPYGVFWQVVFVEFFESLGGIGF
jgi:hypothetical protein